MVGDCCGKNDESETKCPSTTFEEPKHEGGTCCNGGDKRKNIEEDQMKSSDDCIKTEPPKEPIKSIDDCIETEPIKSSPIMDIHKVKFNVEIRDMELNTLRFSAMGGCETSVKLKSGQIARILRGVHLNWYVMVNVNPLVDGSSGGDAAPVAFTATLSVDAPEYLPILSKLLTDPSTRPRVYVTEIRRGVDLQVSRLGSSFSSMYRFSRFVYEWISRAEINDKREFISISVDEDTLSWPINVRSNDQHQKPSSAAIKYKVEIEFDEKALVFSAASLVDQMFDEEKFPKPKTEFAGLYGQIWDPRPAKKALKIICENGFHSFKATEVTLYFLYTHINPDTLIKADDFDDNDLKSVLLLCRQYEIHPRLKCTVEKVLIEKIVEENMTDYYGTALMFGLPVLKNVAESLLAYTYNTSETNRCNRFQKTHKQDWNTVVKPLSQDLKLEKIGFDSLTIITESANH